MTHSRGSKFDFFYFRGHLLTFFAENEVKRGPKKAKNNSQTIPKQLINMFKKVPTMTFLTPKVVKRWVSILSKKCIFNHFH